MLKIKTTKQTGYDALMTLLVFSIWAFNETKVITYPVKIAYIVIFGLYAVSKRRTGSVYQLWCLCMIALSVVAIIVAPDLSSSAYIFVNVLQVFLIGFVTYGYLDDENKVDALLKAFVLGGLLLLIRLLLVTPARVWLSGERVGPAIGYNANDVGNKAAISAIIALCLARQSKKERKTAYFLAFGILTALVLFSGSRKALLAVVAAILLLNTVGLKDKRKMILVVAAMGVLLALGYYFIMTNDVLYETIGRRVETMIDVLFHGGSEAKSIDLREKYISIAWQLIKQHPVFGIGLGAYHYVSGVGVYSHCDYTEVACSYGLIGALIYFAPQLVLTVRLAARRRRSDKDNLFLILLIILLITYITMVMYTSAYVQVLIAMAIAHYDLSLPVCRNNHQQEKDEASLSFNAKE